MTKISIYELGYTKLLERSTAGGSSFSFSQPVATLATGVSSNYQGGLTDLTSGSLSSQVISSGALPAVVFVGKTTFTDTTAGYRMGLDIADNIYKWIIGNATSSADWAVTTANIFTVSGAFVAGSIDIGGADATSFHVSAAGNMWLGAATFDLATNPFAVSSGGSLRARDGIIGGWNITTTVLRSGATDAASNVLIDSANSLLRLGPTTGATITIDGANQRIRSSTYSTGVSGFNLDPTLVEAQNIIARGTLSGSVFRYDVISATGGRQVIANADALSTAMTAADASTLTTRGNITLAVNDILVIRAQSSGGIQEEYLRVTGIGAAPTYTVTRDLVGTYAPDANPAWAAGTAVVQQGESDGAAAFSGGWLDLVGEASSGNFPRVSVFRRTGVGATASTEAVRMGNLNGYLGYVADTFGFGVGSSAGTDANITIDPTNGIRIRQGTTNVITLDNAGNVTVNTITATSGTIGGWTIGATSLSAGNILIDSATPQIRLGPAAGAERVELASQQIIGYGKNGTTVIYRLLQEPVDDNILTMRKYDAPAPGYGNLLNITDSATDAAATVLISTTGSNAEKVALLVGADADTMGDVVQIKGSPTTCTSLLLVDFVNIVGAQTMTNVVAVVNRTESGKGCYMTHTNSANTSVVLDIENLANGYGFQVINKVTGKTSEGRVANFANTANTFNTTAGVLNSYTLYVTSDATRSAGANNLTNVGLYITASGAQVNIPAIFDGGNVFINDNANANMTTGITINQGVATNEILAFKSSGVAHGITGNTETDTFGLITQVAGGEGGISIQGYSETTTAFQFFGAHTVDNTVKTTAGVGVINLQAALRSGTGVTTCGADANLVVIRNNTTTRFIFDAEGSAHADIEWIAFDTHDDLALLDALNTKMSRRNAITNSFGEFLKYNQKDLQEMKIVNFYDDGPRAMVNLTRMHMLEVGAIRQLYQKVKEQAKKIEQLDSKFALLTA